MEREKKEFQTKTSKVNFVIKAWLTKQEAREIDKLDKKLLQAVSKADLDKERLTELAKEGEENFSLSDVAGFDGFDMSLLDEVQDETVKQYLVSIEGEEKDVFEKYLSLREEDANEISTLILDFKQKGKSDFLEEAKKS